jgi:hypothetical protein
VIYITIMLAEQNRRKDKLKARQKKTRVRVTCLILIVKLG